MNTTQSIEITSVRALAEALGHEAILAELEMFNEWDVKSLIELLINHYHFDTRKNIIGIYDLAQEVSAKHSLKHPELTKLTTALFLFFDDLLFHLKKEEQVLFPNMIHLMKKVSTADTSTYTRFGLVKEMVLAMQNENYVIVKKLMLLRELTDHYMVPGDACRYYKSLFERMKDLERSLLLYTHLENDNLFPKTVQLEEGFTKQFTKQKLEINSMFLKLTH